MNRFPFEKVLNGLIGIFGTLCIASLFFGPNFPLLWASFMAFWIAIGLRVVIKRYGV